MVDRYDPYLDDGMKHWIAKHARNNLWRVPSHYDLSDLIQDGYICYYKCRMAYPAISRRLPTKEDRRHFMSLVQRTFINHVHSLALKRKFGIEQPVTDLMSETDSEQEFFSRLMPAAPPDQHLGLLLRALPREVLELFRILASDGAAALTFARSRVVSDEVSGRVRLTRTALRETTNEFYCRLVGVDPAEVDLEEMVREFAE